MDTQPVSIFVTGFVPRPGNYTGTPSDTILAFLDKAGGIDSSAAATAISAYCAKGRKWARSTSIPLH
ncbi:MAG: hypothetical protein ACLR0N_09255 [Bilophila wadsworthia]